MYLLKKAASLCVSTHEVAIVEQLDGVTRANQDTRLVKLLVEVQKSHFPGIVGDFHAVNCPWYYPMLVSLVKPWISKDLSKKIHAYASVAQIETKIDRSMLPSELGGELSSNIDNWIERLLECEGHSREDVGRAELSHEFGESVRALYDDNPASSVEKKSRKCGFLKKRGNWIQMFNPRYVVLTDRPQRPSFSSSTPAANVIVVA